MPAIDVLAENDNPADSLLEDAPAGHVTTEGTIVLRMAAPLFFANASVFAQAVKSAITSAGGPEVVRHLVIDMEAVTDVDVTAAETFDGLREWLADAGVDLAFSRVRTGARVRLERFGIARPDDAVYATNRAAVAATAVRSNAAVAPD
ncbi:sodium-independent anion transporter [Rhodococcus globerulus]|uniref:Sodium-independent anion transporter n=1 Tax=Rhodococcus globerulus TaxID=33008 RepID=A0ABU4C2W1_RHOGO|nr:sodium-independent anion transporter [Rhodococcus globerulus]MDV6270837.1 sodium-independent anion transporter [Rhodococcus globerulus]